MIGRLFINKEKHFFTEGNGRMSFLYNNFQNDILDKPILKKYRTRVNATCHGF